MSFLVLIANAATNIGNVKGIKIYVSIVAITWRSGENDIPEFCFKYALGKKHCQT
jgi:hypothetical protein